MENSIITGYLHSQGIDNVQYSDGTYIFHRPFSDGQTVRSIKIMLFIIEGCLHVIVPLPIPRISRSIGYRVLDEIRWINFELDPRQNYEYSASSEMLCFHCVVSEPRSAEELSAAVEESLQIVSEDIQSISETIAEESKRWALESMQQKHSTENAACVVRTAQPMPHYRNAGVKSRWIDIDSREAVSFSRLQEIILLSHGQVVLMEGPTACGKSMAVRQLRERFPDRVIILTIEDIADSALDIITRRNENRLFEKIGNCDIVCFENIDMLKTSALRCEASYFFNRLSRENRAVVLNGIDCTNRVPEMLGQIKSPLRIFRFDDAE